MENHSSLEHQLRIYQLESEEGARDREVSGGDILGERMPPFFRSPEAARNGLRTHIILSAEIGGTGFITVKLNNGRDPKVYAGMVDVEKVNEFGIPYGDDIDHLYLPVKKTCTYRYSGLLDTDDNYVPVQIVSRREGFRPRVFLGNPGELKDMITRPSYSSNTCFRSFLGGIHADSLKPEDERVMQISNELFNYFEFVEQGEDRLTIA